MCNIQADVMPRSFLMKKYFRRNDSDDEEDSKKKDDVKNELAVQTKHLDILSYPAEYLEYAASLLALSKSNWLQWDYELEKSYWFDTGNKSQESETKTYLDLDKHTTVEVKTNVKTNERTTSLPPKINIESKTLDSMHESAEYILNNSYPLTPVSTTNESVKSSCSENKSPSEISTASFDSGHESNASAEANLEDKLSQMLCEDLEVVTRNIRQFLDNNQIAVEEIAIETGLSKDDIEAFMEYGSSLSGENQRELYKWYLTKVLRPPNENNEQSYTCYKCGKIFTYKSYLERHIKYVCPDSSGRTWKCSFCGKAFQYPCYLRRHIRSHTGESPYKCDKCDRAFVRSTDLQRHIRNHTGEKPYCCKQCSRAFARSTDLKRHMRTHTGEKPYKCWQCGKSFSQSGSLQTHLHTHKKTEASLKQKE